MSFILDALRKVEDEKRRGPGSQSVEPSVGGTGGTGRRRQTLFMGAVALASAAVTALLLSLFMSGDEPVTKDSNGLNGTSSEPAAAADGDDELKLLPPLPEPEPPPQPEPEDPPLPAPPPPAPDSPARPPTDALVSLSQPLAMHNNMTLKVAAARPMSWLARGVRFSPIASSVCMLVHRRSRVRCYGPKQSFS